MPAAAASAVADPRALRLERRPAVAAAALATALLSLSGARAEPPAGQAPAYTQRTLSAVPNAAAIRQRLWVPGLDEAFVPQGMTFAGGAIYLSGYLSADPARGRGPCRLYRIDAASGAVTGRLPLPDACGHAGGAARGQPGTVYVTDTRAVIEVRLAPPGDARIGEVARIVRLEGQLFGSFAAGSADGLWLGHYVRQGKGEARIYRIPFARLIGSISEAQATASLVLPDRVQGAAFDRIGRLWISRSGASFGELVRLDPRTGAFEAHFAMPAGLEDLSFDDAGSLWTVSEAGSRRWLAWATFYPLVFRLEPAALR